MRLGKHISLILIFLALLGLAALPASAQQTSGRYFPQTGHNLQGEFYTFYQSIPDALLVFGAPVTEQFVSADGSGLTVQYFEKTRLELYPDRPIGERIGVTALGTALYRPGAPFVNQTTVGACRVLNGFGVCYEFLAFYDDHGGAARFGQPISAFEFQPDGRIVQYFERARFEWYPELPDGLKVHLGDLGLLAFYQREDPSYLAPAGPSNDIPVRFSLPTSLQVQAFVARALARPDDVQKVFVLVRDQALTPVPGAAGTVTVSLAGGRDLVYPIVTDAGGLAVVPSVVFTGQPAGSLVTVQVDVDYLGLTTTFTTSFRIWR